MKHLVVLAFAAAILGAALGGILIVFRTWMDRALRVTADVQLRLQAPSSARCRPSALVNSEVTLG